MILFAKTIFLSLVPDMAAHVLDRNGHTPAGARLDTVARWLFPLGFVVAVLIVAAVYQVR